MIIIKVQPLISMFNMHFRQAVTALKDNRLRTLLSITGVTVGIAAVIVVTSVSKAGRRHIYTELETFGLTSFWVYKDSTEKDPRRAVRAGTGIDNGDYEAIDAGCCSAVKRITPILWGESALVQSGSRYSNSQVLGVGADYTAINNDVPEQGRFFRKEDIIRNRAVVIIGTETQADLFGDYQNSLGRDVRVGGKKFTVIGVLKSKSRDFLASIGSAGGENANKRILMPFTLFQQSFIAGIKEVSTLQGESVGLEFSETAAEQIKTLLGRRHSHHYSYKSDTMAQYITTANNILRGVTIIGIIAASVSLFVGGLGIMNIMSTSVVERTQEIGLRKAIGARRAEILLQFLFEAMLISGVGGLLGLGLGGLIGYLMVVVTRLPLTASWGMVGIALFVSISVGLVSGYYPAYRAASLRPVEALRHE